MKNLLANHAKDKIMNDPIVGIANEIKEAKELGILKINATLGMFYDDDGQFMTFPSVTKTLKELSFEEQFTYAPTDGGKTYHEAVKKWVLGKHLKGLEENMCVGVVASAGGTGAISNTFSNYLDQGEAILVSDIAWVYRNIAKEYHLNTENYTLFTKEGTFNLESLKEKANLLLKKQERLLIVINDPCQNPTGYTMTFNEWKELIDFINEKASLGTPITLLHDIAYIDYDPRGYETSREVFKLYQNLDENIIAIIAFSGSKTFSLYGLRIGAQIGISKTEKAIHGFTNANQVSSRAKWSNPPHIGTSFVTKILNDQDINKVFIEELKEATNILHERGKLFTDLAKTHNIKTNPYQGGFFITLPFDNSKEVQEALKKEGIYLISMPSLIRVSLSAIDHTQIEPLIKALK